MKKRLLFICILLLLNVLLSMHEDKQLLRDIESQYGEGWK